MPEGSPISYSSTGVDYEKIDPLKRMAQLTARSTTGNLADLGFGEVEASRGESAHVIDVGPFYLATVIEGLGTKNLVADALRLTDGPSFYNNVAQDTVAMIVNDLITVGARPLVVSAYWAAGSDDWFEDKRRMKDLAEGWAAACNKAGAIYGGGETPVLKGITTSGIVDLAGAAVGIIQPKSRLTLGDKLTEGDRILLAPSSGIHANGLTLARRIASNLPDGYNSRLSDNRTFGEALLEPTPIYAPLVKELFDGGVDIHYMVNITGHGFRKLMRARQDFRYVLEKIPTPQAEFDFIRKHSRLSLEEMYGTFNMGAGFAFFVAEGSVDRAIEVAKGSQGIDLLNAGYVENSAKNSQEVFIKPLDIRFSDNSLGVR
ncbi:phosphoribosylformylglycinamidine cyclo-ligase [Candidatus Daviesbacteria bacterium]|nr:phosphoribosylformylglycinamidine cyclo-ligase [Candidatus Daviesbacteria bacterium]